MKSLGQHSRATTMRRTVVVLVITLLILQLAAFGRLTLSSWTHYRQSSDLMTLNEVVRDYLNAADNLDKERALTLTLLSRTSEPDPLEIRRLKSWREQTEQSLARAQAGGRELTRISNPAMQARIADAHEQLLRMRREVDLYLAHRPHAPDQSLAYATTLAQARELDSISDYVIDMSRKLQITDEPTINQLTNVKVDLWLVRRSISNQAAGLVSRAELERPLNSSAEMDIMRSREQGNAYMEKLNSEARQLHAPELTPALQDMTRMLDRVESLSQTQLGELKQIRPLTLSGDAARQELETDLALISDTAMKVADRAEAAIGAHRDDVLRQLVKDIGLGALSLALSLSLLWLIKNRVLKPLRALEAIQDAASEAILIIDGQSRIIMANQGAQRLFNIPHEQLLDRHVDTLISLDPSHDGNPDWHTYPFSEMVDMKGEVIPEHRPRFYMRASIAPLNLRNLPNTALVTIRDDHQRRLAEQANERSLNLMAAIANVEESIFLRIEPVSTLFALFTVLVDYLYSQNGVLFQMDEATDRLSILCLQGDSADIPVDSLQTMIAERLPGLSPKEKRFHLNDEWVAVPIRLGASIIALACLKNPALEHLSSVLEPWSAAYGGIMTFLEGEELRQESDLQMRQAVHEQQLIFSASPVGLLQITDQFAITRSNLAAERIFAVSEPGLPGRHLFELISDEEGCAQLAGLLEAEAANGEPGSCEVQCLTEDGRRIWVMFELRSLQDDGGQSGAIVACIDTTARKHDEIALREARDEAAEARYQMITAIESISEGFVFYDMNDKLVLCNQRYADVVQPGIKAAELIGCNFADIVAMAVRNGEFSEGFDTEEWIRERVRRHHSFESVFQLQVAGRWYQATDRLIIGLGYVGVFTDITDFKDREQQLENARNLADSANRAKSAFLAAMSHEIRTPMNGVLGMLELLTLSPLDGEQKDTVSTIQESARSLLRLIDDILDFSKIEAGKLDLNMEAASLREIGTSVHDLYREVASRKNLWFNSWVDPGVAEAVWIDPLRIRQILHNFLSNAIKFTQAGSVELSISVQDQDTRRQSLRFAISDTGIGISRENMAHLMQPFTQAESDTTRRFGGTGLGLAICKRLAEMMGGSIHLESEPGHGTTAILELTVEKADPALLPRKDTGTASSLPSHALAQRAIAPILFVEDNATNRKLTMKQLGLLGLPFVVAEDGQEALERWKEGNYSMVLTDCHMPYMDGYQLAEAIRRDEQENRAAREVPIVACTANAAREEAERSFAAGMNDILTKPLGLEALRAMVDKWLGDAPEIAQDATAEEMEAPQPQAGGEGGIIDRSVLAVYSNGDLSIECEIIDDFLSSNEEDMTELRQAVADAQPERIAWFAHRIKGASRMVGAMAIGLIAETLEKHGKAGNADVAETLAGLEAELERVAGWSAECRAA
ncbi:ATP-binding protein [Paludibacterium paludis]|uniref:Sensory/regulatory protein RpfC n=1 Tax=Paludibacterium paludis TaxID=1225769 RepID=A0A918NYL6_9NEIS|nr:ATP-binding protein [Paludibacterium paludis]GGY06565.1 hypothetical protein GCM10011289_06370 [Paludibacterium paludis]